MRVPATVLRGIAPLLGLVSLALAACVGEGGDDSTRQVREVAENVFTLQQGTVSALRERTGRGPFRTYDVPPDRMLEILEEAASRARGRQGPPYVEVYVSKRYGEVIAKEFAERGDGYGDPFRSAGLAVVTPVEGRPHVSRVEIHGIHRGPFHRGTIEWERRWPAWIDAEIAGAKRDL